MAYSKRTPEGNLKVRYINIFINSQSQKNRGKITISEQNKDTNARAPVYIYINTFPLIFIEDSMVEGKSHTT